MPGSSRRDNTPDKFRSGRGTCLSSQLRTSLHTLEGDDHVHIAGGLLAQREQRLVFGGMVPGIETVHVREFDDDDPLRFPVRRFRELMAAAPGQIAPAMAFDHRTDLDAVFLELCR